MAWQNLFDASACAVSVLHGTSSIWSGVLGKGDTSPTFYGIGAGSEPMQVAVDSSGVVTLTWETGATVLSDGYTLSIAPGTPSVLIPGSRANGISCYITDGTQAGAAADVKNPPSAVPLSFSGSPPATLAMAPSPADLSAQPSPLRISVGMGAKPPPSLSGLWLMTNVTDTGDVWLSNDPGSWTGAAIPLTTTMALGPYAGAWDGGGIVFTSDSGHPTKALSVLNQDRSNNPLTGTQIDTTAPGFQVTAFPGIMFRYNASDQTQPYGYSTDHGATWSTGTNGILNMRAIARLNSGRWVAIFANGAVQQFYYSDQAIPTAWIAATGSITGTIATCIACDGITAMAVNASNTLFTTTNGSAWTATTSGFPGANGITTLVGSALATGVFLIAGHENAGTFYLSTNSGSTWTAVTRKSGVAAGTLYSVSVHGATVALAWGPGTGTNAGVDVSYDTGATWAVATMPWASPAAKTPILAYLG